MSGIRKLYCINILIICGSRGDYGKGPKCGTTYHTVYSTVKDTFFEKSCTKVSDRQCKTVFDTSYEGKFEKDWRTKPQINLNPQERLRLSASQSMFPSASMCTKQDTRSTAQLFMMKNAESAMLPLLKLSMTKNVLHITKKAAMMLVMVIIRNWENQIWF